MLKSSAILATYLVTGGAGFIGSHLAEHLAHLGHRVRVADSLITGKRSNLEHIPGVDFREGDLADLAFAESAVEGCDYVLHQAAIPSVPRSVSDPLTSHRANVDATVNVLVASRNAGVKRLVFAGSSSVYGDAPSLPKHEDMSVNPLSPYALQKAIGEQYMKLFTTLYGVSTVTTRYFNVFGPRQDASSSYSGVISQFATALLQNRRPTIHGDGEQTRDFTYVANVVDGVLRACEVPEANGEIMNIATGGRISLNELFRKMNAIIGATAKPIYAEERKGDIRHSQADITKARKLLGYAPAVSFHDGLHRTIEWYRASTARGSGTLLRCL